MRPICYLMLAGLASHAAFAADVSPKPRLLVLTDIGGDPDDQQSMIRLLVTCHEFAIEGLVASASGTPNELKDKITRPDLIRELIEAYGRVHANLSVHARGFPAKDELLAVVKSGNPQRGLEFIGEKHDTEGSRWIVACADRDDPRPLNIVIWGGQTDFAQALWRVRRDRGDAGLKAFQARIRVFDIDDQDRIQHWLFAEFPDVFYVLAKAPPGADKRLGAYRGMYLGGDASITSLEWLDEHVRTNHGPLGALYPPRTWTAPNPHGAMKEGDTPSWFFFLPNGLNAPDHPEWGGWGGRYVKQSAGLYRDAHDTVGSVTDAQATVWRWRPSFQNEFAARMDWCTTNDYRKANHPPVAILNGDKSRKIVEWRVRSGESVKLSAAGSSDPDGHALSFRWFPYPEAGTFAGNVELRSAEGEAAEFTAPTVQQPETVHVILQVDDRGTPPLTSFRRAVVTIAP
jgi:hypothetical protein